MTARVGTLGVEALHRATTPPPLPTPAEPSGLSYLTRRRKITKRGSGVEPGIPLALTGAGAVSIELVWPGTETVRIDWGDGSPIETIQSDVPLPHTYSSFTGTARILSDGTPAYSVFTVVGEWSFSTSVIGQHFPVLDRFQADGSNLTTGDVGFLPSTLTYLRNTGNNTMGGDVSGLPAGLLTFFMIGQNSTTGDVADLPAGLTFYLNSGVNNTTFGDLADLPAGLTYYRNGGMNTVGGDIADLPVNLDIFLNEGFNVSTGDLANLPPGLDYYQNLGFNTTFGDLADLPANMYLFRNRGASSASYSGGRDWSALTRMFDYIGTGSALTSAEVDSILIDMAVGTGTPISEQLINLAGDNGGRTAASDAAVTTLETAGWTVTTNTGIPLALTGGTSVDIEIEFPGGSASIDWGDGSPLEEFTSGVAILHTYGAPFTGSAVVNLKDGLQPSDITTLEAVGEWSFTLEHVGTNFPNLERFVASTGNVVSGDVVGLPSTLTYFRAFGNNTTTGDLADLPAGLTYFVNQGLTTMSGDIADAPVGLTNFQVQGFNTTTGDIANLPVAVSIYSNTGFNTTFGDLNDLPSTLIFYLTEGDANHTYTAGHDWSSLTRLLEPLGSATTMTSTEVDNLLIDLAASAPSPVSESLINLTGGNGARTAASDAAVTTLQTAGWTVTTN